MNKEEKSIELTGKIVKCVYTGLMGLSAICLIGSCLPIIYSEEVPKNIVTIWSICLKIIHTFGIFCMVFLLIMYKNINKGINKQVEELKQDLKS